MFSTSITDGSLIYGRPSVAYVIDLDVLFGGRWSLPTATREHRSKVKKNVQFVIISDNDPPPISPQIHILSTP